jgi:hypothetical protein
MAYRHDVVDAFLHYYAGWHDGGLTDYCRTRHRSASRRASLDFYFTGSLKKMWIERMTTVEWKRMSTRARRIYVNTVIEYEFNGSHDAARAYGHEGWLTELESVFRSGNNIGGATMFTNHGIKLDEFAASFLETALEGQEAGESWDADDWVPLNMHSVTKAGLEIVKQYCADFLEQHGKLIKQAIECEWYNISRAGHDLFMDQSDSGVGFWDSDELGELGPVISAATDLFDRLELEWWNPDWEQDVSDIPDSEYYPREGVQITFRRSESFWAREKRQEAA